MAWRELRADKRYFGAYAPTRAGPEINNLLGGLQLSTAERSEGLEPDICALLNEAEEISYHNSRIKSYSQYLLYDDPPLTTGPANDSWPGKSTTWPWS